LGTLTGKVYVLSGGTGAVLRDSAKALSDRGATVAVVARDGVAAGTVAGEVARMGGIAEGIQSNLSDPADVDKVFDGVVRRHGRVDGLLHVTGSPCGSATIAEVRIEEWEEVVGRPLRTLHLLVRAASARMAGQGHGTLAVAFLHPGVRSSLTGGGPHHKAFLDGATGYLECVERELAGQGIATRVFGLSHFWGSPGGEALCEFYGEGSIGAFLKREPNGRILSGREAAGQVVSALSGEKEEKSPAGFFKWMGWGI
jgi:NAD(P)-dependent dehydrogenase (short-subunit alcohol dehydrogenase family)